jgi:Formyl transferase
LHFAYQAKDELLMRCYLLGKLDCYVLRAAGCLLIVPLRRLKLCRDIRFLAICWIADTLCAIPVNGLFLTFDWLLPAAVINKFDPYIVNLHMSLLPLFKGRGAVEAAIQSGMSVAGVTYHRVALEMDEGPLIAQAIVPVRTNSVAKTLGFHLFKAAVPMGIQVARWFENGLLGTKLGSRVDVARTKFDSGPFFPRLDDDIAQYSTDYLNKHYPSDS